MYLKNHPGMWLRNDAALALNAAEDAHGSPFTLSDAGRLLSQQQALWNRWQAGGVYNRPPYLYEPAYPDTTAPHIMGIAIDDPVPAERDWLNSHPEFGFYSNLSWDKVHLIFAPARYTHIPAATPVAAATQKGKYMDVQHIVPFRGQPSANVLYIEGRDDRVVTDKQVDVMHELHGTPHHTELKVVDEDVYDVSRVARGVSVVGG
jgi:hypothetical protein